MEMNRDLIGKVFYPAQTFLVTTEATTKYARAYNEDNSWFLDESRPGGIIAPPMFGVVASWIAIGSVVADPDLRVNLLRLLHSEQDMHFFCPMQPGDVITSQARVVSIAEQATGETLVVEVGCRNQKEEEVEKILFTALIRGKRTREKREEKPAGKTPSGEPLLRVSQTIDRDQTYRYAEASGDHNPIHVDENTARMAGLPGIIVHGMCTMAFTSKVIINHLCGGDPRKLQRLRVCFSRPVVPGQIITTHVWQRSLPGELRVYAYETYNPEGQAVIRDGIAEIGDGGSVVPT
jgi:acyl dehydratase